MIWRDTWRTKIGSSLPDLTVLRSLPALLPKYATTDTQAQPQDLAWQRRHRERRRIILG